jgi:hypothetical protein
MLSPLRFYEDRFRVNHGLASYEQLRIPLKLIVSLLRLYILYDHLHIHHSMKREPTIETHKSIGPKSWTRNHIILQEIWCVKISLAAQPSLASFAL